MNIRVSRRYRAPADRVFDAWLDPAVAGAWLFATASRPLARVEIDPRVGGSFRFLDRPGGGGTEYAGTYLEIVPPRRLMFTLSIANGTRAVIRTRVTAEIVPRGSECELRLTHQDVPGELANRTEGRWTGMLYGLGDRLRARAAQPLDPPAQRVLGQQSLK